MNRNKSKDGYNSIKTLIIKCNKACSLKPKLLSHAAKLHYVLNESRMKSVGNEQIEARMGEVGWELSTKDVKQGVSLIKTLTVK